MTDNADVIDFVKQHELFGKGIGWIDAHLLASIAYTKECTLWTRDKKLKIQAQRLGLLYDNGI